MNELPCCGMHQAAFACPDHVLFLFASSPISSIRPELVGVSLSVLLEDPRTAPDLSSRILVIVPMMGNLNHRNRCMELNLHRGSSVVVGTFIPTPTTDDTTVFGIDADDWTPLNPLIPIARQLRWRTVWQDPEPTQVPIAYSTAAIRAASSSSYRHAWNFRVTFETEM